MTSHNIKTYGTTSSAAFSAAVVPPAILLHDEDNYEEWKVRVKTYLLSQDLWQDVQQTDKPFPGRRRENFVALHVIQNSCGQVPFSKIKTIEDARQAWKTLADSYGEKQGAIEQQAAIEQDSDEEIRRKATLLTRAIYTETLDTALELIQRDPCLALTPDESGESPILALVSMRHFFQSGNQLAFWKQLIYSWLPVPSVSPTGDIHWNVSNIGDQERQSNQEDQNNRSVIKQLLEMKAIHVKSDALLSKMCEQMFISATDQELKHGLVYTAITRAAKNGIFEFFLKMMQLEGGRRFLKTEDRYQRNIFMLAVLHRHEKIFSILYELDGDMSNSLTSIKDVYDNNMLHMAGMIEDSTSVNKIPGAALQMQRELQWFKEVERIVHPKDKESTNNDGLTPQQLFTKNHADLMEKGQKWMKVTATSCTVVGALIVTMMFAVASTVPGGNDQTTGFPIFLKKKLFVLFIICDALSLFSSSTSILMFLEILTSSYAEDDFLEYLPRQMIIGLYTLLCSIATMMIAFSAALIIMLHEQYSWISSPIISLAWGPVNIFFFMKFPLLKIMTFSTYGSGIFHRKKKL
ncbi:hypothetical protein I3760_14G127500 [Carya illinoinensis]|nr:hypothetical protein I3760_14G127500 [Carya illinoinensis]KAG2671297.1 hypothetical protein I3760_14G127500 [Carya illinoinensis]KAG2671298.1 hypothetical protein I3760_14G127500 [Carya illinoinensis]